MGRRKRRKKRYFIEKILTNANVTEDLNNTKCHSCDKNSNQRINKYLSSLFHFLIISRWEHHLNASPCYPDYPENGCYTYRISNKIRKKCDSVTLIGCRWLYHITRRDKFICESTRCKQKGKNEWKNLVHGRKLWIDVHDIENHTDETIREKCDNHGNNIPFDNGFCLARLLRIPTREYIIISCNYKRYTSNQRNCDE